MTRSNKATTLTVVLVSAGIVAAGGAGWLLWQGAGKKTQVVETVVNPSTGSIVNYITATATVQPQNRLEINPPIAGLLIS